MQTGDIIPQQPLWQSLNAILQWLLPLTVLVAGLSLFVLSWLKHKSQHTLAKVRLFFFLSAPVWLAVAVFTVVSSAPNFLSGLDLFRLACFVASFFTFGLLAWYPAITAHTYVQKINAVSKSWGQRLNPAHVKQYVYYNRVIIIFFLINGVVLAAGLDVSLFKQVSAQYPLIGYRLTLFFWALSLFLASVLVWQEATQRNKLISSFLPATEERYIKRVAQCMQKVAASMGAPEPFFMVIENSNPNAFTLIHSNKKPCIFITSSLLKLFSDEELEVVLVHEIAHLSLGGNIFNEWMGNLLKCLGLLGFFGTSLFLALIHPALPFVWAGMVFGQYLESYFDWSGEKPYLSYMLSILNPTYTLTKWLEYFCIYFAQPSEEYMADLQAVGQASQPSIFQDALGKIIAYQKTEDLLSVQLLPLYFAPENATESSLPLPQLSLEKRLHTIFKSK